MGVAMLIGGSNTPELTVGPEAAERLAQLGISRVAVLADEWGIGVVLEGWAFDPTRVDAAVLALFPDGGAGVRLLHEVELVAVAAASHERRT